VTVSASTAQEQAHQLWNGVLAEHVREGEIDFARLCRDPRLGRYTDYLSRTDPDAMADNNDKFAFWLNVYNAYSLQAICKEYPIKSINDLNFGGLIVSVLLKKSVWDQPMVVVNNKEYTLREVDHEILRPTFKDARIQFAIACGAIGCPPSRSEAYEGSVLDAQLDDQTKRFINDASLNSFNTAKRQANLSPLFNWSKKDFGNNDAELLAFIAKYVPGDLSRSLTKDADSWKIKYNKYDLTLNDAKK
ncbi:MAG: DUF547 domain-containing protein, partial [Candidatus Omnitrophica bacterium]|nr:DUF547 domain-containing protein [Candidatus Omnitrophota bacterium]